jgi:hypothetical protein
MEELAYSGGCSSSSSDGSGQKIGSIFGDSFMRRIEVQFAAAAYQRVFSANLFYLSKKKKQHI